ncbi:SpaA isopeptide-forming pilin-related protein [Enterococcus raffinosus]|uniref:SpaA isopeptide-forming pilin-related protein n=1 Tax=Enterococcus raffinosus TaxID=71452 RepID=A0AAW8SZ62_9ENTE|nr:collagen binding domain-containing protein [Enterococcus raffinosus]MDT2539745.1 SpaA isopeptide-forming pilin-related protein [Enterococcus raffinosus]
MENMRKARWMPSLILVISLLFSLIPINTSSRAENVEAHSDIEVVDTTILDAMGELNSPDNRIKELETVTIELAWQMISVDLIEEGETRELTLPEELSYIEQNGILSDGMGSFQVSNGILQFTFAQNYQMTPDERLPDYQSVKHYQGSVTIQAEVPKKGNSDVTLDFGNQVMESLFIETEVENKNEALREAGRDLNALGTWVLRSMKVTDENGENFSEEKPPTRDNNIQVDFEWQLENEVEIQSGDYYTYQLPDYFAVHQVIQNEPLKNETSGGEPLGSFDLYINGLLTIKFNDEAAEVSNRKGTIHLSTQLDVKQHIEEIVTEEQINEDGSTSGEVKIKIAKAAIKKTGSIGNDNIITWEININENSRKLANVKVTDYLQANHKFVSIKCEVPDEAGDWKEVGSEFYHCLHFEPPNDRSYFELSFPNLDKQKQKLTHPVKFIVRSRITDSGSANAYQNTAAITGSNFIENGVEATVSLVDIPSYKFLIDSEFENGIFDWRMKATIKNDGGEIIDQMYKNDHWSEGALHYFDPSTLAITDEKGRTLQEDQWSFIRAEEVTKKDKNDADQIVRFGIKFAKAGIYYLSYKTKAFEIPPPLNEEFVNYLWVEGKKYNGSSGIDDEDTLGVTKSHQGTDYMKRELTWWTTINKNKIVMKNAKIEDKYSSVNGNNKSALRLNEDTLHIYPLKKEAANDNDIDESRELRKGKDFILESKGENYKDGFVIRLIGDYASTDETLQIRYNTHFMMEYQSPSGSKKSNYFVNSAIVTYQYEGEERQGYDSDETEVWIDSRMGQNGWKYGTFVAKGEEYKNQVSPFAGEKPAEDSVYWTVPINSWGVKLNAGTIIWEDIHEGQSNPEVKIHKVIYDRPEYGLTGYGDQLEEDIDYEIISNGTNSENFGIKLLKEITEPFALFIKVKADEDTFKYKNKAEMDFEGEKLEVEAFVEKSYKTDWLTKNGSQEMEDSEAKLQANYEIILNKDSRTINDPIITDTITINEQTFQQENGSVKVKAYKAIKKGNLYVKGEGVDLSKEGRSVQLSNDIEKGTQTLTISLGESISEPYIIEYSTNIDPALKNGTQISNKASLFGKGHLITETVKQVEVKSTQGSGTSSGVDGALRIRKIDEKGELIDAIAEFALFRVDKDGKLQEFLPSIKVKKDRIVQIGEGESIDLEKISNLRYGKYAIQEIKAPDGYELDDTVHKFIIDGNLPEHEYLHEHKNNKLKPFELAILKKSMMDERELQGGEFALSEAGNEQTLATATTDKSGIGKFQDAEKNPYPLLLGKDYIVKETKAPDGFVKLKGAFTVSISKQGDVTVRYDGDELDKQDISVKKGEEGENAQIQFTARNNPRTPLPKTGGAGGALLITLGLVGLLVGLWYHFSLKKEEGWS